MLTFRIRFFFSNVRLPLSLSLSSLLRTRILWIVDSKLFWRENRSLFRMDWTLHTISHFDVVNWNYCWIHFVCICLCVERNIHFVLPTFPCLYYLFPVSFLWIFVFSLDVCLFKLESCSFFENTWRFLFFWLLVFLFSSLGSGEEEIVPGRKEFRWDNRAAPILSILMAIWGTLFPSSYCFEFFPFFHRSRSKYILMSLILLCPATVFNEFWKRKAAELSFSWGTLEKSDPGSFSW